MSAVTQCPACGTLFRVLDEQLRISKGWVRCGQCHEVFDAQLSLQTEPGVSATQERTAHEPTLALHTQPPPERARPDAAHPPHSDAEVGTADQLGLTPELPAALHSSESGLDVSREALLALPEARSLLPLSTNVATEPPPQPLSAAALPTPAQEPSAAPAAAASDSAIPWGLDEQAAPSFLQNAKKPQSPLAKWTWAFFGLVLLLGFLAQALWFWRNTVAAHWPHAGPWLARMCDPLGCEVTPPQWVDALQVDAVTVKPMSGGNYRLSVVLKSSAPVQIASPALELSLQDSSDTTLVKRVLSAQELGLPSSLAPRSETPLTVSINVQDERRAAAARVAGYRVIAFYP